MPGVVRRPAHADGLVSWVSGRGKGTRWSACVWCVWGRDVGTYQSTAWPGCPTTGTGAIIPAGWLGSTIIGVGTATAVACIGTTCAFPCGTPSRMPFSTSPSCIAHRPRRTRPRGGSALRGVVPSGLRWWSSVVFAVVFGSRARGGRSIEID
jgi:hypothetical protein